LDAALKRPYATFDLKEDLYPTPVDKAAAIIESIIINHPFLDGNKRLGYVLMRLVLLRNKLDINATEDEKYESVISISKGELKFEQIRSWIKEKIKE
jgi:death-on-curing protein